MIILSIGSERGLFQEGHPARLRIAKYGSFCKELHIIVFSLKKLENQPVKIAPNVWVYPTNSKTKFAYMKDAAKIGHELIKGKQGEKIVATAQDPFEAGAVALALKKVHNIEVQLQVHADIFHPHFKKILLNKLRLRFFKDQIKKADRIRVVSQRIKNSLLKKWPTIEDRITVLPIYVTPKPATALPEKPISKYILLTIGRLQPEKNHLLAIEVLQKLIQQNFDASLIIVGEGPLRPALEKKTKKLRLDKQVIFAGWQGNPSGYYKISDIYLGTSLYEGYGLTLLEAALAGCPIVSTDVGIAPELAGKYTKDYICAENADSLAKAIQGLLENPDKRAAYQAELEKNAKALNPISEEEYLKSLAKSITG